MDNLKEQSSARICLLFTKLGWYFFFIIGAFAPITIILAYLGKLPDQLDFTVTLPIHSDSVNISSTIGHSAISLDSAKAQLDVSYLSQQFPDLFLSWSIFGLILLGIILACLYHLKNLLQTTIDETVFTQENIRRIKIIAFLIFAIDPLHWIHNTFFSQALFADFTSKTLEIAVTSPFSSYWFIGLLIFTLAAIFEKGQKMYQELKLTV